MVFAAILLAAGESTRMGQLKALLPWQGTSLIAYQLEQLRASRVDEIVVVLGYRADELAPLARGPKTRVVLNPDYRQGKTTSIRVGVTALADSVEAALILGVDQPRPAWLIDRLVAAHATDPAPITTPSHGGRQSGHPPIFARSLFPDLLGLVEDRQGLRELFTRYRDRVQLVPVEDPIVRVNLNTPEDYESASRLVGW